MASIYKRTQDKSKNRACWYFNYVDANGQRKTRRGFTDKRKTEQLAADIEHRECQVSLELVDTDQERFAAEKKRPLVQHVADFEKSLSKRTEKYRKLVTNRLKRVLKQADLESMATMTIAAIEAAISEICEEDGSGHQTYNHYVDACRAFCKWMLRKAKRISVNPLEGIEKLNVQEDIRHPRRALKPDEFSSMVNSARSSGVSIQCYDGETRARIYILSYLTGLRRKELASLTKASFSLGSSPPSLTVEAAHSKHRRKDTLPLHPELIRVLPEWLADVDDGEPLFPKLANRKTYRMVRLDLERAGISYQTAEGIADFHAAGRHTHITELLRNGASLVEARELARHSDIKMTMKYTHIGVEDQAKALRKIPTAGISAGGDSAVPPKTRPAQNTPSKKLGVSWEYGGDAEGQNLSPSGNNTMLAPDDTTPVEGRGCGQISSSDKSCQERRTRGSNPQPG